MNMPTHRDDPECPADEWQAQEQALRAERLALSDAGDDERLSEYRQVARALRRPLADPLPTDFAERVAQRVRRARPGAREGFDRLLGTLLPLILLTSGIGYSVESAHAWWQAMIDALPAHMLASPWLPGLAICAGLTALLGMLPPARFRTHR